jgi:hypothetical protein
MFKALGDSLAAANGYTSEYSKDLYDHGGTTDAWSYYVTGGLGFVFEMNSSAFHPPFAQMVGEYDGTGSGGNREAFYRMTEFAANPAGHAVLRGSAPAGAVLRVAKNVIADTQEGPDVTDHLETTTVVPADGQFEWHVNQSRSPFATIAGRAETWTLTCEIPEGTVKATTSVTVARGQVRDVSPCPVDAQAPPGTAPPPPGEVPGPVPPLTRHAVAVKLKLASSFDGKLYRVTAKGSLRDPDAGISPHGNDCAGKVQITISGRGRRVAAGGAPLDAACGFERTFRVKRTKLPRALRKRRPTSLVGVAAWNGNEFLLADEETATSRVKKKRRR